MKNSIRSANSTIIVSLVAGFAAIASLGARSAAAAWEARVAAKSLKGDFNPIDGKLYHSGARLRVDATYTMDMQFYGKAGATRIDAAVPLFRMRLHRDKLPTSIPSCLGKSFDSCVSELKLKKTGIEKCGEKDCEVWEGAPKIRKVKSVKVWHWVGEKEPILSKVVVNKLDGDVLTAEFTEIEKKTRPESFYVVPADYKDAGTLEKFFGDIKGKMPF